MCKQFLEEILLFCIQMFDNHRNTQNSFVTDTDLALEVKQFIEFFRKSEDLADEHLIFVVFLLTVELYSA